MQIQQLRRQKNTPQPPPKGYDFMIQAFKNTLKKFLLRFFPPQEIHYIGSAETLPPPLSPDAEEELIDMLRQKPGD